MSLDNRVLPGQTIGIIGGGQLGRMMAIAARNMGYRIAVLDPTPDSPCGQVADDEITGSFDDIQAIKQLAKLSDVITYEFENIDYQTLTWLEKNANLPQGSKLLKITQDRESEKKAITDAGAEVAPYRIVDDEKELLDSVKAIGLPCVLKTCRGGYDGKGQYVIKKSEDIQQAASLLGKGKCILEGWVPFEKEVSVIVTRNAAGEISTFPVAENIHVENILHQTIVPARITKEIEEQALQMAVLLAKAFNLIGTLAVEMFVTKEKIYINELAPRPHNSGHFSIDACETSQFEQQIRAVCNLPLGKTSLLSPAVMVNILGEHVEPILTNIDAFGDGKLHLYGKKDAVVKRKMGHVTFLGNNVEEARKKVTMVNVWNKTKEIIGG